MMNKLKPKYVKLPDWSLSLSSLSDLTVECAMRLPIRPPEQAKIKRPTIKKVNLSDYKKNSDSDDVQNALF